MIDYTKLPILLLRERLKNSHPKYFEIMKDRLVRDTYQEVVDHISKCESCTG